MIGYLKGLLRVRRSIAAQLYAGLGGAVALTMGASVVAWIVFSRVGDAQRLVNEGSVPDMAAAFAFAQHVGALVDSAPRLTVVQNTEELAVLGADVAQERRILEDSLANLAGRRGQTEGVTHVRALGGEMLSNIESIEVSVARRLKQADRGEELREELRVVDASLSSILATAIDDQFFYAITGYTEIGKDPAPRELHFTESEINRYRRSAELKEDAAIGIQLLASAFSLSDADLLEPLRERYEATLSRIDRNLVALGPTRYGTELVSLFERLFKLSIGEDSGFDHRASELRLAVEQADLLVRNREIATEMISEVEGLVSKFRTSALVAARSSTDAIQTGRSVLLALNVVSITGAVLIAWLFIGRFLLRRIERLSSRMRKMAGGDLEAKVEIEGSDEVADMAAALEVFRRHALEVQRLNLVEKLAEDLRGKNSELESVLADLRKAQNQIVMREKLAALGELTAGVAHEIRNPLNFVKNFAEVSEELLEELQEVLPESSDPLSEDQRDEIQEICSDLTGNLERIRQHGDRANRIVHDMLMMGRGSSERRPAEINSLVREHMQLAYHSARATDADFQLHIEEDFDQDVGEMEVVPQDLGRVVLNMVSNACYATDEKRRSATEPYVPTLRMATRRNGDRVEIRVRDNGNGIPVKVREKIFNPFFTTKPTDQGTGLGLALSNDIVREHGGEIRVDTQAGEYTEMIVDLPVTGAVLAIEVQ